MLQSRIPAFLDGNSFVEYNLSVGRLLVVNSEGLTKVFDTTEPDLEPTAIDSIENLTAASLHASKLLVANTSGSLELINIDKNESAGVIYRSELPLRDVLFINEGKRILCGGDDNKLTIIDHRSNNALSSIPVPEQIVSLSYNPTGEMLAVSFSSGDIQLYSVMNEVPNLLETISSVLPLKIHTSLDTIDYVDEHKEELISTRTNWTLDGESLLVPTSQNSIAVYDRKDWKKTDKEFRDGDAAVNIVDYKLSPNSKHLAVLFKDASTKVFDFGTAELLASYELLGLKENLPINLTWNHSDLYVGTTNGQIVAIKELNLRESEPTKSKGVDLLFLDEAEESDDEGNETDDLLRDSDIESRPLKNGNRVHNEDSMIIDEDDDDKENDFPYYNKPVDNVLHDRRSHKRQKGNGHVAIRTPSQHESILVPEDLKPYSPGSTPWSYSDAGTTATSRRYLSMSSIGYTWAVKTDSNDSNFGQQSITISFFDRTNNKDYHFIDYYLYDLCSVNEKGAVFANSGYKLSDKNKGQLFYRHHSSVTDSWDRTIPLLKGEHITSVSLTNSTDSSDGSSSIIVLGTNFGYVRFFNLYGVCIKLIKTTPVVTLISSSSSTLFLVNQVSHNVYSYSVIDIRQDYKFIQQDVLLPLKKSLTSLSAPLIKGIFFNEYNDPCLVPGNDDTLIILSGWRETGNARWIPLLNCHNIITEYGNSETKKRWKCWPLGLYRDQLSCLILKNNDHYPAFPLPLPIELDIKIPILTAKRKEKSIADELNDEADEDVNRVDEDDPEEQFLRASTMGKIVSDSLNDGDHEEDNDEIMERLQNYSMVFDRSLLKLFANACQESRLNKALSIVRLIKNDKALSAASKIAERFEFNNLATKIGKLREDLVNLSDDEE